MIRKNVFIVALLFLSTVVSAQTDSLIFKFCLDIVVSDIETGVPIVGAKGYLICNAKDSIFFTSDVNGRIQLETVDYPDFFKYPAEYKIYIEGIPKLYYATEEYFALPELTQHTRYVRDVRIKQNKSCKLLPDIVFKENSAVIDSTVSDSLLYTVDLLKEYPEIVIEIRSLYDSEREMKLAQKRADAIVNYFASHGIDTARVQTKIAPRPPSVEHISLVTGEFVFLYEVKTDIQVMILSFDYIPQK